MVSGPDRPTSARQSGVAGRRVLVTGAAGRIGSAATELLVGSGARVRAMIMTGDAEPRGAGGEPVAAEVIVGDTRSESDVAAALDGIESVVHLAALPSPLEGSPYEVFTTNVVSTFNVLHRASAAGVRRAVIASSINANGLPYNSHEVLPAYYPLDEQLPIDLDDPYSLSKQTDEHTARMISRHWGTTVVALRFPFTMDRQTLADQVEDDPRKASAVREGWSYLDVRDAARAIELALVRPIVGAHAVLVAADQVRVPYRTEDLLDACAPQVLRTRRFVGREVPMDLTRAKVLLGFRARHLLDLESRSWQIGRH